MTLVLLMVAPTGAVGPARGISTPVTNPILPVTADGGVLMLPLTAERPGDNWPQTILITLADGGQVTGHVAWIAPAPRRHDAGWTDSALMLTVRGIRREDRTEGGRPSRGEAAAAGAMRRRAGTPFLLAQLPPDATGSIRLLNQTLEPRRLVSRDTNGRANEAAAADTSDMLRRTRSIDRPDPEHPLEYWRWVLLADRLGKQAPPLPESGDAAARLAALHTARLWQVGLDRVREQSRGVADHLVDMLTRICTDGKTAFAAWVADPVAVNALLNILLDDSLSGRALIDKALEWSDTHERLMFWLESAPEHAARLAIVNPSFRPLIARLRWDDPDEIPIAVELPAGQLTRVRFERSGREGDGSSDAERLPTGPVDERHSPDVLLVEVADARERADAQRYTLVLDVPVQSVTPPGASLPALSPTLTLASVQHGQPPTAPERYATAAQLRRLHGRWELFIESRRPSRDDSEGRADTSGDNDPAWPADLLGREGIALLIGEDGRDGEARTILHVPEHGKHQVLRGEDDPAMRIHRRSVDDRWYCRVVLPDAWIDTARGEATDFGVVRFYADGAVATSPVPVVPWRIEPGRLSFDLSRWDDVPVAGQHDEFPR